MKTNLKLMRKTTLGILCCLLSFFTNSLSAQQQPKTYEFVTPNITKKAQFPGGEEALKQFIATNLVYPLSAKQRGIEGKVVVQFGVFENGEITHVQIMKSLDTACDNEVLRLMSLMPKWEPAEQTVVVDGKSIKKGIKIYYSLPVNFRLKKTQGSSAVDSISR